MKLLHRSSLRWSFRTIFLLATGGVFLISAIGAAAVLWPAWERYVRTSLVIDLNQALGATTFALARERGAVAIFLAGGGHGGTMSAEEAARATADATAIFEESLRLLDRDLAITTLQAHLARVDVLYERVDELRDRVRAIMASPDSVPGDLTVTVWIDAMTSLIQAVQDLRLAAEHGTRVIETPIQDLHLLQHFVWAVAQHAGRERALIGSLISSDTPIGFAEQEQLDRNRGELEFAWNMATAMSATGKEYPAIRQAIQEAAHVYFVEYDNLRKSVIAAGRAGSPYPLDAGTWFARSTDAIDTLIAVETEVNREAERLHEAEFQRTVWIVLLVVIAVAVLTMMSFLAWRLLRVGVIRPLHQLVQASRRLAHRDTDIVLPSMILSKEVAAVAAAIDEFREDAIVRTRLENELRLARDKAESANLAKSQFLANVSHELRTPLNAIIGFTELMKNEAFGPMGPKYLEYVTSVHASGVRLLEIVNDILDMVRAETDGIPLNDSEIDLAEIVRDVVETASASATAAGASLIDASEHLLVRADPARISQSVSALLGNAIRFNRPGGKVAIRTYLGERNEAVIEIADDGPGMTQEDVTHAFEPFWQRDAGLNRRKEGLGLGVSLANAIARAHGGRLEIDSVAGAGTTARLVLPAERVVLGKAPQVRLKS